ncbi:hypothetical protein K2D_28960 [Planctomycetes bacterium K2D]|nr:hypothetical protein K2D_28960 [Planctomycetes bacterium K2D]
MSVLTDAEPTISFSSAVPLRLAEGVKSFAHGCGGGGGRPRYGVALAFVSLLTLAHLQEMDSIASDSRTSEEIDKLFARSGGSQYGGEAVTQLEHGLQAALLAEQEGAPDELVVAALLHDIGHLLHDLPDDAPDNGVDDLHENLGAAWIEGRFPASVLEPVRLHVESKRYLCAVEPGYLEALSEPSRVSLQLQGGPMTTDECESFQKGEFFGSAIRLRRWDDEAKVAGLATPPLSHYKKYIEAVAIPAEAK